MILFWLCIITAAVALFPHLLYILLKGISIISNIQPWMPSLHFHVTYKPYCITALVMMSLWLILFTWGHCFGRYFFEVKEKSIAVNGLPESFSDYRIVHISDLHLDGWNGKEEKLQEIVDSINAQHPDLICFTGDLISLSLDELPPLIPVLKGLKAKDGVVAIMGNHDYLPYNKKMGDKERAQLVKKLQTMQREQMGWKLLLNENIIIHRGNDSIAILGCENQSMGVHSVVRRGDLKKSMAGTDGMCRILLTHDPTHWRGEVVGKTDIPLTLSGHTHSGQFRVLGFSAARFIYNEYDGLYAEGNQQLYVNIGLGGTMPMRIGATPEITVLNLAKK